MWIDQDWTVLPTPHVASYKVFAETHSVSLQTGDGSPLFCRTQPVVPGVVQFDVKTKQLPCLEVEFYLNYDLSPPPPYDYTSDYFIGQTFSDFEFLPDGNTHTFTAYLDRAWRYGQFWSNHGSSGELLDLTIDSAVPTNLAAISQPIAPGIQVRLYAEQNGNHFFTTFVGTANFMAGLTPGYAGDWGRWASASDGTDTRNLNSSIWLKIGSPTFVGGTTTIFIAGNPDWSNGAPPIYFGWCIIQQASQQVNFPPGVPGGDIRFTRTHQIIHLDRLCINIQ